VSSLLLLIASSSHSRKTMVAKRSAISFLRACMNFQVSVIAARAEL
jgi:hypothetical protein